MIKPQRGDIYHIDVLEGEIQGHELWGPHAWVVISIGQLNERLELFTAVPLTSIVNKKTGEPKDKGAFRHFRKRLLASTKVADSGVVSDIMKGNSLALPEQIRVFSSKRLTESRLGILTPDGLGAIELGLAFVQGKGITREIEQINAPDEGQSKAKTHSLPPEPSKAVPGPAPSS